MIHIPPEIRIAVGLRRGAVYYFTDDGLSSEEPHHFVLISEPISSSTHLLLVVGTSQVEKRERYVQTRGLPAHTLVHISAGTLPCFTKDTVFDCNTVFERTGETLVNKLSANELKIRTTDCMPEQIIQCMIQGVLDSPLVVERIKQGLRQ